MSEFIGILATLLVLLSFLQKSEEKIRVLNVIGAFIFVVYGLAIDSFSVWFMNSILIFIHSKRLYELRKEHGTLPLD
nr:MAG TPA: inner membrane protein [Caudoviricetes sp.]